MYSPEIVEKRLRKAKEAGFTFQRCSRDRSIDISKKLEALRYDANGKKLPNGALKRDLDDKEKDFIRSERIICKADFSYYLTRYHAVERDPGVGDESGIGPAIPLESQIRMIELIGRREEVCYAELRKYSHTSGILCYCHKCRQVAFTSTSRAMTMHRMLFYPGTRALAGCLKEGPEGTGELYKRDKITIDNLPFWLYPEDPYPDVKDTELGFVHPLNCRLKYTAENSKGQAGIGTGSQTDVSHLTEVPLWSMPGQIRFSFIPGLPKAVTTLHIQEGTSAGKGGYWQDISEGCRHRRNGFEDYIYIFVPWWMNTKKYRGNPPDNWIPEDHTIKHAELIERTSPEFNDGKTYRPTRDQLFWWEKNRALHAFNGELASFLANYPATPEQSFTNWAQGALPVELIEKMEMQVRDPYVYEVEATA